MWTSKNRGLEELLDWFHDHYALPLSLPQWDICMTTPFDYKYQNPWGFACLTLIRVTVNFTLLGIQNLNKTGKTNFQFFRTGVTALDSTGHFQIAYAQATFKLCTKTKEHTQGWEDMFAISFVQTKDANLSSQLQLSSLVLTQFRSDL